jgi:hypothetical protein
VHLVPQRLDREVDPLWFNQGAAGDRVEPWFQFPESIDQVLRFDRASGMVAEDIEQVTVFEVSVGSLAA